MDDLFKKFLYSGVGLVSSTAEKAQKAIDELVEKGKLSSEDGKKVVDDIYKNVEGRKEEFEGKLRTFVDKALEKMNLAQADDLHRLEKRIKSLEVKLGLLNKEVDHMSEKEEKPAAKPAAKKAK